MRREGAGEDVGAVVGEAGGRRLQANAILTMCRTPYTVQFGEHVAEGEAAWACGKLPEWAGLIRQALAWRVVAEDGVGAGTRGGGAVCGRGERSD